MHQDFLRLALLDNFAIFQDHQMVGQFQTLVLSSDTYQKRAHWAGSA